VGGEIEVTGGTLDVTDEIASGEGVLGTTILAVISGTAAFFLICLYNRIYRLKLCSTISYFG